MGKPEIRLGVVGLRNIGMNHVRRAAALEDVTVAALADTDADRLQAGGELAGTRAALLRDAEELLEAELDAVVLAVPNHLHAPMSVAAMRNGKHVLVEKPMAMNPAEAEEMIRARDETGRVLMVGMNQRFTPAHAAARRAVAAGMLGQVLHVQTGWVLDRPFDGLWARGDWFLTEARSGGGPLLDLGIHRLDLALYLLGMPAVETVSGFASRGIGAKVAAARGRPYELEDYARGFMRLEGGVSLTLEAGYFNNVPGKRQETVICGTDGAMQLGERVTVTTWSDGEPVQAEPAPDTATATSCVEHFCRVLRGEEDLGPTAEQGLLGHRVIDAIYTSARTGDMIALNGMR